MPADVAQILREYQALESQTTGWLEDWQAISELLLPGQSDILTRRQPGTSRTRHLYDSTAMWALDTFVAHLGAWVTNWQSQWFAYRMRAVQDSQVAAQWLDAVAQQTYETLIADEAPVPTAVHEAYRQYGGMGTGGLFIDEQPMSDRGVPGFQGYQAYSLHVGSYAIAENASGRVDTIYRTLEMTPHQAEQQWGREALHPDMQAMLAQEGEGTARRYLPQPFLHAIYPRRGRDRSRKDQAHMAWASCYVDMTRKHLVHEGGYRWFPACVFRWEKLHAFAPWGFGRGHLVLPEAKTLQLIDRDVLRALPLQIMPPGWLVGASQETIGRVSLLPGSMNPLAQGGSFVPYTSGQRWDASALQIQERQSRILRAFYIDQLQFLPEPTQRTTRTLGELQLRQRQMARIMGPAFQRLLAEFLNPFMDITFSLLLHAGVFPDPPEEIIQAALLQQGEINVEYLGPLARAQRDDEVDAILESVDFLVRLAQETQDPTVLQNVALDETVARFLDARGFPAALVTDRRTMAQIRQEAQRQVQQQQQLNQAGQLAQAAGQAAPALQAIQEVAGV